MTIEGTIIQNELKKISPKTLFNVSSDGGPAYSVIFQVITYQQLLGIAVRVASAELFLEVMNRHFCRRLDNSVS